MKNAWINLMIKKRETYKQAMEIAYHFGTKLQGERSYQKVYVWDNNHIGIKFIDNGFNLVGGWHSVIIQLFDGENLIATGKSHDYTSDSIPAWLKQKVNEIYQALDFPEK